jgi:hypothetical protein
MRKPLPLFVISLLAVVSLCCAWTVAGAQGKSKASASDQMIIEKSRATWEAYKNRNKAAMAALTAKEYASNAVTGPSTLQEDLDTVDKLTIEAYTIDEPKVTWINKGVAILRYKAQLKGSFDGKPFVPVYATEVWVNRAGKWQIFSYQETPIGQ